MPPPNPTPQKKSRGITMAILGAVTLCSCCCCLLPAPQDDAPTGDGGGGSFEATPEVAADGTPTTGTTGTTSTVARNNTDTTYRGRSHYGGPFWLPLFFGNSYSRGPGRPSSGPGVNSPSRTQSPGVGAGGFGGTGRSMGGGSSS